MYSCYARLISFEINPNNNLFQKKLVDITRIYEYPINALATTLVPLSQRIKDSLAHSTVNRRRQSRICQFGGRRDLESKSHTGSSAYIYWPTDF